MNTQYFNTGVVNISTKNGMPNAFPATIAPSGNWQSGIIVGQWAQATAINVGVTSSQAGALSIQRYLDLNGNIPVAGDSGLSQTLVGGTPASLGVNDGQPWLSFQVTITNTGGSTANITNIGVLVGPPV